ncbi:glutaminase A [Nocardioides sp. zg-579]|uniref:Glutaminase n=1 Tax=Nocardioides marmotae TaxID=2663857 RepID=A0A6I3JAR0_9ACTN|nr:glutaminase A [Nocardioides marmotae]MCR6031557.1 glutaminase A [Gordonia jinghuaiqii]MTB95196.1 glutaminase A [Nocardioides marmotae]QKE02321.1 glutaminase A [Nocardioides marmotae]
MGLDRDDLTATLAAERERLLPETSGEVGDPSVAGSEGRFGIAVVTAEGETCGTEDADVGFPVQSVVKPWVYAVALADRREDVHEAIGVEPTGEPFDALELELETGRPPNPMVNAGALMAASLVAGTGVAERVERVLDVCSRAAGRRLSVDEDVVAAELEGADRNRALAHLMRGGGMLPGPVEDTVEVLARVCSIEVTALDLAAMAATLARWGRHPGSEEQVVPAAVATEVLSVMATCGMYDGSGWWIHRAGMPAKSGVSGSLMAVAPGVLGLGAWSPPLDGEGNSVRALLAGVRLSEELGLHTFAPGGR